MPRCQQLSSVLDHARPGDVLLTGRPGEISKCIQLLSDSPVSHAILVLPEQQVIMAHLPRTASDSVVQRYTYSQLQAESWTAMYCQRHQGLDSDGRALSKIIEMAEMFERGEGPEGKLDYKFGTADMVIGAVLCMLKPASKVIRLVTRYINGNVEQSLRKLFDDRGGPAQLFCSEFVYRCFLDASQTVPSAAIDTSMLILREWAAIFTGQQPLMAVSNELSAPEAEMTVTWLDGADSPTLVGPGISQQDDVQALLVAMRDFLRELDFQGSLGTIPGLAPSIADFVTPVDLLRSPTFCTVAWWGTT